MGLPWVRLDANIGSHDKILNLLGDPSPKKWQAATSYVFALGWAGGQGTDGRIPAAALPFVHGTTGTARLLEKYCLWHEAVGGGWQIVNYADRQQISHITNVKHEQRRAASEKANCTRWHGPNCWSDLKGCTNA